MSIVEIIYQIILKDGAYVINLDEYSDIGTHWIALYVNNKTITYFDSFEVKYFEVKKFIGNKNIISNIYIIQNYDSIMCGYFCVGSIMCGYFCVGFIDMLICFYRYRYV